MYRARCGGIAPIFFRGLIRGPLGEEVSWRGYALAELQKRYSHVPALLILGVIWVLWHFPLWFVTGYSGIELLLYALFFTASIVSFSIIIGVIYRGKGNNLIYTVILHQMFNFTAKFIEVDTLLFLGAVSVVYGVLTVAFGLHELYRTRRRTA